MGGEHIEFGPPVLNSDRRAGFSLPRCSASLPPAKQRSRVWPPQICSREFWKQYSRAGSGQIFRFRVCANVCLTEGSCEATVTVRGDCLRGH